MLRVKLEPMVPSPSLPSTLHYVLLQHPLDIFYLAQSTRTPPIPRLHLTNAASLSSRTSSPFLEEIEVIDHAFDLA
jgi:hypothetical protein